MNQCRLGSGKGRIILMEKIKASEIYAHRTMPCAMGCSKLKERVNRFRVVPFERGQPAAETEVLHAALLLVAEVSRLKFWHFDSTNQ